VSEALKQTLLSSLLAAWTWPSYVVSALSFIDSDWAMCLDRAVKAGKLLAETLLVCSSGASVLMSMFFVLWRW
jgi:hypothetical protein